MRSCYGKKKKRKDDHFTTLTQTKQKVGGAVSENGKLKPRKEKDLGIKLRPGTSFVRLVCHQPTSWLAWALPILRRRRSHSRDEPTYGYGDGKAELPGHQLARWRPHARIRAPPPRDGDPRRRRLLLRRARLHRGEPPSVPNPTSGPFSMSGLTAGGSGFWTVARVLRGDL